LEQSVASLRSPGYLQTGFSGELEQDLVEIIAGIPNKKQRIMNSFPTLAWRKAGSLAEHFNEFCLVRGEEVVDRVKIYSGEGTVFLQGLG
jgi:hypothetical protein